MKAIVQRCLSASVSVEGKTVGECEEGLTIFLGVESGDVSAQAAKLAQKISRLRIFDDADGRFNFSLCDVSGSAMVISNFTICGDSRKGNRPSFSGAAPPDEAKVLYEEFCDALAEQSVKVARGVFGASMTVDVVNDGPVTMIVEV